jgi:putative Holliday junction resolvase
VPLRERILALDLGEVRTGVAISDPGGVIARPHGIVTRDELVPRLRELVRRERIREIVVGVPRNLRGEAGFQARRTMEVLSELRGALPGVRFVEWDERFTTRLAAGSRKRGPVDDVAAAHMLQEYLTLRRGSVGSPR